MEEWAYDNGWGVQDATGDRGGSGIWVTCESGEFALGSIRNRSGRFHSLQCLPNGFDKVAVGLSTGIFGKMGN